MYLSDVYAQLCAGELSKVHEGSGQTLDSNTFLKTNALITAGIADLNKHFTVRENEILVRTKPDQDVYELVTANAVSNGNPDAFIIDSGSHPFMGDIMQILSISDENGQSLYLHTDVVTSVPNDNIYGNYPSYFKNMSINMLAYNTLKLGPKHGHGDLLIRYKARIKPVLNDGSTGDILPPEQVYIDVPDHFLNALVLYVASRKFNPMGSETIGRGMFHEGNNYWTKYLDEINNLKANFASIGSQGETTNFQRGGWV